MSSTQFFLLLIFYKDGTLVTFNKLILTRQKKKVLLKVMHSTMDFSLHFPELCDDVISWGVRQEGPRQLSSGVIGHLCFKRSGSFPGCVGLRAVPGLK